ncbi:MAG: DUF4062 domain-containing protein [Planctomycetes bacterium]|nr:DUF4062 domain-containing protein [Planctomycetota bacterium]
MHEEREELIKQVFPKLRKLCEDRGVIFADVDLRWGITQEQAERGEVLPVCLGEIERCRPFFICLLGQRYGWVPGQIPQELVDEQPWLAEHRERSITELETIHGVLNNPAMTNRAWFYFRDPAYIQQIPFDRRADFIEQDEGAREKLAALKERIRRSGLSVHEDYPDPQALGRMALQHLADAINQEYPPESRPDPLARDAAGHDVFAQSRASVYVERQAYFDRLDEHALGEGPPLVILGNSGCGKSALVGNWALRYRGGHADELVLMHFVGATRYSADWTAMLRRIMGEFKRRFDIEQEIPDKPEEIRSTFANWLHVAAAR